MKKVVLIGLFLGFTLSALPAQTEQADEDQIRVLIGQFSAMWTQPDGLLLAERITSSNFIYIVNERSFNKMQFLQFLETTLQNGRPKSHNHEIYEIAISDNLAYEYGLIEMEMANGNKRKTETFNVFAKENDEWKLLSNLPVKMMKTVLSGR